MKRLILHLILLPCLFSCGQHLSIGMEEDLYSGQEIDGGLVIAIENFSLRPSRTITPDHITSAVLVSDYDFKVSGTTGFQSFPEEAITIDNNGKGVLRKIPEGEWELTITAYNKTNNTATLRGRTSVSVTAVEMTTASFMLRPIMTGNGTVNVQFNISQSVVSRLDTPKQATVALYYSEVDSEVPGTQQKITLPTMGGTIIYTANQIPEGNYFIKLTVPYTVNNGSTLNMSMTHTLYYEDVLYVESNRTSAARVTIDSKSIGIPSNPFEASKRNNANFSVISTNGNTNIGTFSGANITGNQSFNPYGEGLWIYAANWDGSGGNTPVNPNGANGGHGGSTQGNEVLLVTWDAVYNADYYELEVLLHPSYGYNNNNGVSNGAKYEKLPVSDTDWEQFLRRTPQPLQLRFTGSGSDSNYYQTKTYTYTIARTTATKDLPFTFLAWREIATGTNNGYKTTTNSSNGDFIFPPDNAGLSRRGSVNYRIGLEGDCDALAILMHNFTPQHWYGIRVRGVNEYGYSDWIYWKGGRN